MIVGAILFIAPLLLIYVLYKFAKQRNNMAQIKANSVPLAEHDKVKEERDKYLNDYTKEVNRKTVIEVKKETEKILGKKKFNPADLSYQELEACTNYFVENQNELKSQPK